MVSSCQNSSDTSGVFKLLPQPQKFEITGDSPIQADEVLKSHGINGISLPVLGDLLAKLEPVENASEAQVLFRLDNSLDVGDEG